MKYYLSIKSISKKFDVSEKTVKSWLKKYDDLEVIKVFGSIRIEMNNFNNHIKPRKSGNGVYKNEQKIFGIKDKMGRT